MATAERNLFSDTARSVRTGDQAVRTHQSRAAKIPPSRTDCSSGPYGASAPSTAGSQIPYSVTGEETGPRLQLIDLMLSDIESSDESRALIADAIGVSQPTLDSWLARTRMDRMMPVTALAAWTKTTKSAVILNWIAGECELAVVDTETLRLAELGKITLEIREREARMQALLSEVA